jgi:apolipoprotein N-acyltransferase
VQTNISQDLRNGAWQSQSAADNAALTIARQLTELLDRAAGERPDLIILPETSFPVRVTLAGSGVRDEELDAEERRRVRRDREDLGQAGRRAGTAVLLGVGTTIVGRPRDPVRDYNSALLVRPDGTLGPRYDKMHRVPFGEYVPLEAYAPWLQRLTPYQGFKYGIDAGESATRVAFSAGGRDYRFGTLICYEDSDAPLARAYAEEPSPVDFLVNISNDGWFRSTAEHEQHLAVCRFRAVENRRPVVRAVNMGISAVIDGDGRVVALPGPTWATSKGMTGVVTRAVPLDTRRSVYTRVGDWLPAACGVLVVIGCVGPRKRVDATKS